MPRKKQSPPPRARRRKGTGSIKENKRRGIWEGAVTLPGEGRPRYVTGATYAEVDRKLADLVARQAAGPVGADEPVGTCLARWLEGVAPDLAHDSVRNYRLYVGYLEPIAHIPIGALTVAHVEEVLTLQLRRGIARTTLGSVKGLLARALRQAERQEIIPRNVAERAELPGRAARPPEVRPLTPDEARALLAQVRGDRMEALYTVVLACGIRQGEALGLRWEDVDLGAGVIRVRMQLKRVKGERGEWSLAPLKTAGSRRVVHLPPVAIAALARHREIQQAERSGARPPPRRWGFVVRGRDAGLGWRWGLVFTTEFGAPIHGAQLARTYKRHVADAGLPPQRFHDARHFAASLLLAQGVPERVMMDILGHRRIEMTRHYSHVFDASRADAAARIEAALGTHSGPDRDDTRDDSGDSEAVGR